MFGKTALILASSIALYAQSTVQGPAVGWVYDSRAAAVRAVLGVPGSSTLGSNVHVGDGGLSRAVIAPDGRLAIASAAGDGRMLLLDLRSAGRYRAIDDAPASADEIVFSPSGAAALLIYRSASKAIVLADLFASVLTPREINFGTTLPEAWAIADDAKLILAAAENRLIAVEHEGNRWNVNFSGSPRNIAFLPQSHDALVTGSGGLWMVEAASRNAQSRLVWEGDALEALSLVNRRALILTSARTLNLVDVNSGTSRSLECSCQPETLARMSDSVIRVNRVSDGPLWLVDFGSQDPRVVFVPAEVKSEQ